jgi:type IV pilus assembly protein PilM
MSFLSKKIFNFDDKVFALDLSDLSVKILELSRGGKRDKIRSFESMDIPRGCIEDGKVIDKAKVAQIIRETIKKAGPQRINTKKVVCSIPESKAFLRIINVPKVSEEEAREAIRWELEANIPLTSDQVYFDWQFLSEEEGKQRTLTVAVAKEIIDALVETLSMAGLEVYGLEVESIATIRSLVPSNSSLEDIYLIVDMGATRTSFIVSEGVIPYFTSSIPFSSEVISDAIAGKLGINLKEANKIKMDHGIEHSFESSSIFQAIRPMLESLAGEIEKTIDFYKSISKNSSGDIKKIILSGGGSNLRGILPYLATRLSREVVAGDPWINLRLGNNLPIIDKENSVRYSTAVGLALKSIDHGDKY